MKAIVRAALVGLLSFSLGGAAFAQTEELKSTSVLPADSPFFAIQRLLDSWEEFLAFAEVDEARVQAKIARNRLAEAVAMLKAGKADLAASRSAEFAERTDKAAAELAKEKTKGAEARQDAIDRVLEQLIENDAKRQAALEGALENVENPRAREAIESAMERSKKGLETAREHAGSGRPSEEGAPQRPAGQSGRPDATASGRPGSVPTARPATVPGAAPSARPAGPPASPPGGRP